MVVNVDDWHALLARMNRPAMLALTLVFVTVEPIKNRWKIFHNALQLDLGAMDQLMAVRAKPFECIQASLRARYFDDDADCISRPLRRVAHVLRQQENLALFDRNLQRRPAWRFHDAKNDISL